MIAAGGGALRSRKSRVIRNRFDRSASSQVIRQWGSYAPKGCAKFMNPFSWVPRWFVAALRHLSSPPPRFLIAETIQRKFRGHGCSRSKKHAPRPRCRGIYGSPAPRAAGTRQFVIVRPAGKHPLRFPQITRSHLCPRTWMKNRRSLERSLTASLSAIRSANALVLLFLTFRHARGFIAELLCTPSFRSLSLSLSLSLFLFVSRLRLRFPARGQRESPKSSRLQFSVRVSAASAAVQIVERTTCPAKASSLPQRCPRSAR